MLSTVHNLGVRWRNLVRRLRPRRNDELGREQGQTIVRVAIVSFLVAYLWIAGSLTAPSGNFPFWLAYAMSYLAISIGVAILAFRDTTTSLIRRTLMNIGDAATISYIMIASGKVGVPLFFLYLWITLGNGFRFGTRAMLVSAILSLAGFCTVIALSPFWNNLPTVAAAIVLALITIPLYAARVLKQRAANASGSPTSTAKPKLGKETLQRLRLKRHDELGREQGQCVVRVAISVSVLGYLIASHYPLTLAEGAPGWLMFLTGFIVMSTAVTVHALRDTKSSVIRRTLTNAADVTAISYLMAATGETGVPLFVLYLWITLGNGFRFGVRAMAVSAMLSIAGFSGVVVASDVWRTHPMLSAGVIVGLILIPGYTAHLIRQLHLARQRAEEASAAKSSFLARMSHELRTPLNGILGTTELLSASKRFSREDRSLLAIIRDSVKVSMRQIDNVLDFSKIEAGKLQIEQTDFDLHELLSRTLRLVRNVAVEKNIRLILRVDPSLPYLLIGDPHHVQEVLINLLSNAVKFTDRGYVTLEAKLVEQTANTAMVRLEVHDTGIGIEVAAIGRIFEAFSQEDSGTTRRYGGTGLGTTIAKQLVDLMGGKLSVASIKGEGSTFRADLPFGRTSTVPEADGSFADMRALLISKDITLQDRLTLFGQKHGLSLQSVITTDDAEGLLRRGLRIGNPFQMVFADSHAMLTCSGAHRADDFVKKAGLALTPVFLICDVTPEEAQLRQWGYAGVLSYDLPPTMVFNAVHASKPFDSEASRGVARVEPWAWNKSTRQRQRPRLLVADDNRTNLMIMRKILETSNYEVDTAEDGETALEMMLRGRYKAAVLDMHMPGLDGIAVIKQYRLLHRGARTPIVILTANATVDAKLESAEAGADAYLTKPATASTIIAMIERLLDDTVVYEISSARAAAPATQEIPVLDTALLVELDRMYNNPAGIGRILEEFESESRRLLDAVAGAVADRNHGAFCDSLHALKGNGANVGALRLAQTCQEAEAFGVVEFRRDGAQLLQRLKSALDEAVRALRDFTATDSSDPAQGSDLT